MAMGSGAIQTAEAVVSVGGEALAVEYTASPLRGESGEIVGAVEYIVDISERKQILEDLSRVAQALANADLTAQAQSGYVGDYQVIAENLNRGIRAQHDTIAQVAEAVDQVATSARQISSSAQLVAQGASEQASSLEETSSSLEEISSQTRQNADNTQQARGLAQVAYDAAQKGNAAMGRMTGAMKAIKKASGDTGSIIKDINEIAFQTNLLALNAAVEAARAGDAGRGFAVVAEEVRNLAMRAKEAAKKTEDLIAQSVRLSEEGETISREVSGKLSEIGEVVKKVTDIASEIAAASDEQARGIGLVNNSVADMDKVVQQAAANSEETSAAVQELSSRALELAAMISRFALDRPQAGEAGEWEEEAREPMAARGFGWADAPRIPGGNGGLTGAQRLIPLDDDETYADF
jgi:methyl-accepting chemotaxis protein